MNSKLGHAPTTLRTGNRRLNRERIGTDYG